MRLESRREHELYEDEVRRIARALWPSAEFDGARIIGGRETDGVFVTEESIHIIEATISRRKQKAQQDIDKLARSISKFRPQRGYRSLRGWFITRDEPTAEQRQVAGAQRDDINVVSFAQFQARLIDSNAYLEARGNHSFGSVRDPMTDDRTPTIKYVPLDMTRIGTTETVSHNDVLDLLSFGRTVVLLGDYGAGKSMTLREIYHELRARHLRREISTFPVYLNLREHYGQTDPAEVILRHARSIGFSSPSHLVRAWRAGYTYLLIDGFDEISTINIQGLWRNLRSSRYRAMEAVRRLIREHPTGSGLLLAGRAHFFDSDKERREALGLRTDAIELSVNEFTDEQIATYLKRAGLDGFVPSWLPSRPLLVGYLAAKGSLHDLLLATSTGDPLERAVGWDTLIDRISEREAEIEAGIDGSTVRKLLERLSTNARATEGGVGPLSPDTVIEAFRDICGDSPDERGMILIQRLPGLGVDRSDENSRTFIDHAFADVCRAGDLIEFVGSPYDFDADVLADIASSIGTLGIEVAAHRSNKAGYNEGIINAALARAKRAGDDYLASDIARLIFECNHSVRDNLTIGGVTISELKLDTKATDMSKIQFRECFFRRVDIDLEADTSKLPTFFECFVEELDGRISDEDLPHGKFNKCVIDTYSENAATTAAVLSLDLPLGVRVCVSILRKLYEQRGAGRKENALHRGLDNHARRLVPGVLRVLQGAGLASPDRSRGAVIWRPDRSNRTRVGRMISAPATDNDDVLRQCSTL